jgi:hypothetical protein
MMHPWLELIVTRPQLLAEHAQGYAELGQQELARATAVWKRQALFGLLGLGGLLTAAVLAGVALMLWAVTPSDRILAPWALLLAPLLPLALAIGCLLLARMRQDGQAFGNLRQQFRTDMDFLRETGGS